MSEEIILISLPKSKLEELRCFTCKGYLSCSPIRLLPNGSCICGRCSLNTDTSMSRNIALEAVLSEMSFPCIFKKYGCPETLLFGKTADHESKCVHKPIPCPVYTPISCLWDGCASQLWDHFKDEHPHFLKDKAEFNIEIDKDTQGVFVATEDSFVFIVKYFYNAKEGILKYDVRFCSNKTGAEVFFKMQLINNTDPDCKLNLKMNKCCSYDENFSSMQNAKVLNITKFLECINDPNCIVVALKLKVDKSNSNNVTTSSGLEVNFDVIKTLKCYKCQNYLVPPLFDLDGQTICCDCGKSNVSCKSSNDADLLKLVNEAVYPFRWRECNFVGTSNVFKDHVMDCQFRLYCCAYSNCNIIFTLSAAVDHLRTHEKERIVYLPDKITYKTSFAQSYPRKDILTIKNKRIILINQKVINSSPPYTHRVDLYTSPEDLRDSSGIVNFEHEHCKVTSKEFYFDLETTLDVTLKELPPCFKEQDELTVTIEVNA